MKKILSIILSLTLVLTLTLALSGCNDSNNSLANNISESVKKVKSVLNQATEVSNEDLVFEEIMSLSKTPNNSASASKISNSSNKLEKKTSSNKQEKIPAPNLTRQIVKRTSATTSSTLGLITNDKLLINKAKTPASRLTSRRQSDSSRLTSSYYTPRRATSVNYNNAGFVNYLGQVEDLYLMMNDAVYANNNINSCKNSVLEYCDLLDILSQQLKSKEIQLTDDQVDSCKGLLGELGNCTNKVASSRNDVKNGCNSMKQSAKNTGFKVEQISSNYVKLINSLENRESYYEGMLSCLKQIQAILAGNSYNSNYLSDNKVNDEPKKDISDNTLDNSKTKKEDKTNTNNDKLKENTSLKSLKDLIESNKKRLEENGNKNTKEDDKTITPTEDNSEQNTLTPNTLDNESGQKEEIQRNPNTNIDTYKEQTIKPNVIDSRRGIQKNENRNSDNNNNERRLNENNNREPVQNQQTPNNDAIPNTTTYGINGIQGNNIGAGMGGVGAGVGMGGVGAGVGMGGVGAGVGMGGVGAGVGMGGVGVGGVGAGVGMGGVGVGGVGTGVGGAGGYYGVHNYENGVINPSRNTDTYKLNLSNDIKPLPSETRKNFKPFSEIKNEVNQKSEIKITPLQEVESKTETNENQKITIKTFKVS